MVELIQAIAQNSGQLWAQILITIAALGAFLKGVEAILQIVAPLTPWTWDDNIATMLGKIVANKIFHKKV
jgi:hypothetical protein